MMLNAILNTLKVEKFRRNSCLYPNCASISQLSDFIFKTELSHIPSNSAPPETISVFWTRQFVTSGTVIAVSVVVGSLDDIFRSSTNNCVLLNQWMKIKLAKDS
jgi:hypothetical protein